MEKNQATMKKKNMSIKIVTSGGGGLAGIILLGGALATAALVSTFAFKTKQNSKKSSKVVKEYDKGLSFLVSDSLPPQQNHRSSSGAQNELVSVETMVLDETIKVNGEKDEEIDILNKARGGLLCDESADIMEEFPVPVADSSLLLKAEEMKKNDQLEENAELKANEKNMMVEAKQVGIVRNYQHILVEEDEVCDEIRENTEGNNKLIEAALDDQVGVDSKEHMPADNCIGTRDVIIERGEIFLELPQSEQQEIDFDYHKLGDECDGKGQVLVETREELVKVAMVDEIRADDNTCKGGKESDDNVGVTIEKDEELVGDVAVNGIKLSEKSEFTILYGYQEIICSDGIMMNRHENGICDVKKTNLLLPVTNSSSLLEPADSDLVENRLIVADMKILGGREAYEIAVQEDSSRVEDRGQTQLFKENEDSRIYRETTDDKWEGADEIGVENDQQRQPCQEYQKNHIEEDQKYSSEMSSPDSFPCNGFEVQEFSFPLLGCPPIFNFGDLIKDAYSETALHMEDVNPVEKDVRLANEIFAHQIIIKNEQLVQSAKNDEMKSFDDGSENHVVKGEETLGTGLVDIGQQTELIEQYNFNNGSKNDEEALEMIQTKNFELENKQQSPLKEDSYHGNNVNREEDRNGDSADEDEEENNDSDEEDNVDESSETTGDSSLDSNAEAIWPVESVQEFSEKVNYRVDADNHNYLETEREDSYVNLNRSKIEEEDTDIFYMDSSNNLTAEITTLRQPTNFSSLKFWFLSLLVPFLLVLWLLSSQISFPGLSYSHF